MGKTTRILFISHDASRTGAPIVLLHFLKWLSVNSNIEIIILCKSGGALIPDFKKLGKVIIYNIETFNKKLHLRLILLLYNLVRKVFVNIYLLSLKRISLIYSNTLTNGELQKILAVYKKPQITHVHELELTIQSLGKDNINNVVRYTDHYIAVSNAVKENLEQTHNIASNQISLVKEFIVVKAETDVLVNKGELLNKMEIPENSFIVGGSGVIDWRKGWDLFLQIAYIVTKNRGVKDIYFIWLGANNNITGLRYLNHDIHLAELDKNIRILKKLEDPSDIFSLFDVFLLTSREDPYPLVCLEAAALGKPIIAFEKSGGMPEFIADDAGRVIPYFDLNMASDEIIALYNDPQLKKQLGRNAQNKVLENHTIENSAPKLFEVINGYI